jgi:hypothetical protein
MSGFRDEVRIIPVGAWVVAVLIFLPIAALMLLLPFRNDPELRHWPLLAKALLSAVPALLMSCYALLIGYVYADARRRSMRHVMWTLLAALIPNAIGIILYFVLREPLLQTCPRCRAQSRPGFTFCPSCGAALARTCPQCRAAIEAGWSHCARCGAAIPPA